MKWSSPIYGSVLQFLVQNDEEEEITNTLFCVLNPYDTQ